jgi:hypothetical protein
VQLSGENGFDSGSSINGKLRQLRLNRNGLKLPGLGITGKIKDQQRRGIGEEAGDGKSVPPIKPDGHGEEETFEEGHVLRHSASV